MNGLTKAADLRERTTQPTFELVGLKHFRVTDCFQNLKKKKKKQNQRKKPYEPFSRKKTQRQNSAKFQSLTNTNSGGLSQWLLHGRSVRATVYGDTCPRPTALPRSHSSSTPRPRIRVPPTGCKCRRGTGQLPGTSGKGSWHVATALLPALRPPDSRHEDGTERTRRLEQRAGQELPHVPARAASDVPHRKGNSQATCSRTASSRSRCTLPGLTQVRRRDSCS